VKGSDTDDAIPPLAPRAWLPLIFVVVALVLLFGTPLFVSYRVQHVRNNLLDVAEQARVVVNDFEAAFATELLASHSNVTDAVGDSISRASVLMEREQARALDSLTARLGPDAVERVVALRAAEQRWRMSSPPGTRGRSVQTGDSDGRDGTEVLAAAESLDRYLLDVWNAARDDVRGLERINVYSAAALAPIALIAVAVVFMLDKRMRVFAREAHERAGMLQRSVERQTTLIRGVTHDIKNPLGAASGYAELLADGIAGPMNEQQSEMVKRLKRLVATAQDTVTELLEVARGGGEELAIERRDTDIVATVRDVVADYEAGATQKKISLTLDAPLAPLPPVVTDPARVRHVLENLLSNAIKYTPPGGTVAVGVTAGGDGDGGGARDVRISVRDTGAGIPSAFRDRIFDEFFRIPSSDSSVPGSGLGLAISRRIARLLGGDITVADPPERGSIFTFALPATKTRSEVVHS
jgi:signal transduction histidine kinase